MGRWRPKTAVRSVWRAERFARRLAAAEFACAVTLAAALAGAHVLGIEAFAVRTDSMAPAVPAGSLALVRDMDACEDGARMDALPGNVVAFRSGDDDGAVVLHRVVSVDETREEIVTKGDANAAADPYTTPLSAVIGVCFWAVPGVGAIAQAVADHRAALVAALAAGNVAVLAAAALEGRRRKRSARRRRPARHAFRIRL